MKKLFTLVLALVAFFVFLGVSPAQEKKLMDKASPKLFTGKVTQADEKNKTVTISGKDGEKVSLNFSDAKVVVGACKGRPNLSELKRFPKMGDNVQVARYGCDECLETC